ncbi:MAG: hypothetical protein AAFX87_27275, partial [Bacteroidota bacterium]
LFCISLPKKYKRGDCLEFMFNPNRRLGVIITNIYNSHYDLTLTDIDTNKDLILDNFKQCSVFGTKEGSVEDTSYLVNVRMLKSNILDKLETVRLIGNIELNNMFDNDGYGYLDGYDELETYFDNEIKIRTEKTKNANKFPSLGFMSRNLLNINLLQ